MPLHRLTELDLASAMSTLSVRQMIQLPLPCGAVKVLAWLTAGLAVLQDKNHCPPHLVPVRGP